MRKKPVFVIIGEVHPISMEGSLKAAGILALFLEDRMVDGKRRKRVHASQQPLEKELNKRFLRAINRLLNTQARILKKEGIERLFVEMPCDKDRKEIYARYRETHDLKQLQSALREEFANYLVRINKRSRKIVSKWELDPLIKETYLSDHRLEGPEDAGSAVFALSHVTVAHRAEIFDIIPIDIESRDLLEIECWANIKNSLPMLKINMLRSDISKDMQRKIISQCNKFSKIALKNMNSAILEHNLRRERGMYEHIMGNCKQDAGQIPSALICGAGHVELFKALLSQHFEVRMYSTGKALSEIVDQAVETVKGY